MPGPEEVRWRDETACLATWVRDVQRMLCHMSGYPRLTLALVVVAACDTGGAESGGPETAGEQQRSDDAAGPDPTRPPPRMTDSGVKQIGSPDGAADAMSARLVDGGNGLVCEPGTRECSNPDDLEYAGVGFSEEPRYDADYNSGDYERMLTVGARIGPLDLTASTGQWHTLFAVESDRPSKGELEFSARPGLGILQLPATVHLHMVSRPSDCITPGPEHPEPVQVAQNVVRDGSGTLLIARGINPLPPGGAVLMAPGSLPELSMRWHDVGCPECWTPGMSVIGRGKGVELSLTVAGGGEVVHAAIGERTHIQIGKSEYVFVPRWASVPVGGEAQCGSASWTLYRPDVLVEVAEAMAPGP